MTDLAMVVASVVGTSAFWILMLRPVIAKMEAALLFEVADHLRNFAKMHLDWQRPGAAHVAVALEKAASHITADTFLKDGVK